MGRNPSLRAALYDYQQAHQQVLAEEGRYVPTWGADVGITHTASPRLSGSENTTTTKSDSIDLGTELEHTFAWGTSFSVRLEGARASSETPYGTGDSLLLKQGPGYGLRGRLTVTQPLLQGFGFDVGEADLRQAKLTRTAQQHARDQAASEVLRDVLVGYWELWYTEQAIDIDRAAATLARQQRDDKKRRIVAGAEAPVDLLSFETRVAELEQAVLGAEAQWRTQSLSLGTLLGRGPARASELHATASGPASVKQHPRKDVLTAAVSESYTIRQLKAELAVARDQATIAGESERPRLDLEAYVQTEGLGNQNVGPAFEQFGTFGAVSAHVGLSFSLPLSGARRNAQRRVAELSVEAKRERLQATVQATQAEAASHLVTLAQARRRIELAQKTVQFATRNVVAQRKRYEKGDAIALEVNQAEDELRKAQLTVQRARVDAAQSSLRLDHMMGKLLARHSRHVPKVARSLRRGYHTALVRPGPF